MVTDKTLCKYLCCICIKVPQASHCTDIWLGVVAGGDGARELRRDASRGDSPHYRPGLAAARPPQTFTFHSGWGGKIQECFLNCSNMYPPSH